MFYKSNLKGHVKKSMLVIKVFVSVQLFANVTKQLLKTQIWNGIY